MYGGATPPVYELYPACNPNNTAFANNGYVVVKSNFNSGDPAEIAASLSMGFAKAGWIALTLHAVGVEIYLGLTPREGQRLREVIYQRQMERGIKNPGSAGLVAEKLGDAEPWVMRGRSSKESDEYGSEGLDQAVLELPNKK
jgi:hypothetical protein